MANCAKPMIYLTKSKFLLEIIVSYFDSTFPDVLHNQFNENYSIS